MFLVSRSIVLSLMVCLCFATGILACTEALLVLAGGLERGSILVAGEMFVGGGDFVEEFLGLWIGDEGRGSGFLSGWYLRALAL